MLDSQHIYIRIVYIGKPWVAFTLPCSDPTNGINILSFCRSVTNGEFQICDVHEQVAGVFLLAKGRLQLDYGHWG